MLWCMFLCMTKSNHPVLLTVFCPLLMVHLRGALQTTLSNNIQRPLDGIGVLVWDITAHAEVFQDTEMGCHLIPKQSMSCRDSKEIRDQTHIQNPMKIIISSATTADDTVPIQKWGPLYHQIGRWDIMHSPHVPKNERSTRWHNLAHQNEQACPSCICQSVGQ